jgi:3alpha(or 20beta)-hydroxysteroid dehydrogenase
VIGRLEGKVTVISGGAGGQGSAQAERFVAEGAKVVLGDIAADRGTELARVLGSTASFVPLDVTSEESWEAAVRHAVEAYGHLDVLINNAGIVKPAPLIDTTLDDYMSVIQVNQVGTFLGMKVAAPEMAKAGGGSIINTSSIAGLQGVANVVSYVASKFAITGMTKVGAIEFGRSNIRVNSIHPGAVDTPMIAADFDDIDQSSLYDGLPAGRVGRPEDIANLCVFLASDESEYCTGAEFVIDGGFLAGPMLPKAKQG